MDDSLPGFLAPKYSTTLTPSARIVSCPPRLHGRNHSLSESTDLSAMKLVELKSVATRLGIKGVSAMRKGDLVAAIQSQGTVARRRRGTAEVRAAPRRPAAAADRAPSSRAAEQAGSHASSSRARPSSGPASAEQRAPGRSAQAELR